MDLTRLNVGKFRSWSNRREVVVAIAFLRNDKTIIILKLLDAGAFMGIQSTQELSD